MENFINHLYALSKTLNEIQVDTNTSPIRLSSVDIELQYDDYNEFIWDLNNRQDVEFKNIQPCVNLHNGRVKGYTRVLVGGFTFNIYLRRDDAEYVQIKPKPYSRFY